MSGESIEWICAAASSAEMFGSCFEACTLPRSIPSEHSVGVGGYAVQLLEDTCRSVGGQPSGEGSKGVADIFPVLIACVVVGGRVSRETFIWFPTPPPKYP